MGSHTVALASACLVKNPRLRDYDGRSVIVGIRPEDYEDAELAPDVPEAQRITSKVSLLEALGSEIMAHFHVDAPTVDSGDPDAVEDKGHAGQANAVGRFNPRSRARMGQQIEIAISTENMHFFDPQTRQSIEA
jgi:multiple sugar transport system ATP-binding protein